MAPDPTAPGGVRVTTWRIELGRAPARLEPVGRRLGRALLIPAALAVDLVTAPAQFMLFSMALPGLPVPEPALGVGIARLAGDSSSIGRLDLPGRPD